MNASYDWLKAFVPFSHTPQQLRDLLTAHTATVEELVPLRDDLAPIVVARVAEAGPHPDSDHLWLTQVDAGGGQLVEVVCGAPTVIKGALYPFAPVGTTMPNGMKIERRKIRGVYSNGMLCSARELGLGDDHQGILQLDIDASPGTPFLSVMPVGDTRLVVDVGANRPDLLSHLGLAREVAAITGTAWRLPEVENLSGETPTPRRASEKGSVAGIEVRVEADTRTRRYMAAVVRGVTIGNSPEWLMRRIDAVGLRTVNNVVDATNYVLHELGQPIHAFDLARLTGPVVVRAGRPGEKLVTLDGTERTLPRDSVVIADARGAQAVAGVMGGRETEVTSETRDLFIEVASFDPKLTRSGRKALGMSTDASHRFERGVDPELGPLAMDRVVRLILALAGGTLVEAPLDIVGPTATRQPITVRMARVAQVLGEPVSTDASRRYLERIGFHVTGSSADSITVFAPSWRSDVAAEIDLVEEIARLHGYDKFPVEIRPYRPTNTFDDPHWTLANRLRDALIDLGLYETRPVPFVRGSDETHVRVSNPLAENEGYLRNSLLETLSRSAELNLAQRTGDVRLFEIGSTFLPMGNGALSERLHVAALVMGRRRPPHFTEPQPPAFDEWDAKGIAETTAHAAFPGAGIELAPADSRDGTLWTVRANGRDVGSVRRVALDAPVWASPAFGVELVLDDIDAAPAAERGAHAYDRVSRPVAPRPPRFQALPTMPAAEIDLALLVADTTPAAEVERVIRASAGDILERLDLFDQYIGEGIQKGYRSLAWRLTFRHPDRTLRDKEIEGRRNTILAALQQELNVRQRST